MDENPKLYQPGRELLTAFCGICRAPSTNRKYYGAVSCYSCRVFFQRGISRKYTCIRRNSACEINHGNRKFCRACRFKRCLEVGMLPSRVGTSSTNSTNSTKITGQGRNKSLKKKGEEENETENVVELPKNTGSFNLTYDINGDEEVITEDGMEMPILPDYDLETVLNSLSSEGSVTTLSTLPSEGSLPSPLTSVSSFSPLSADSMEIPHSQNQFIKSPQSNLDKITHEEGRHEVDQLTLSAILDMNETDQLFMTEFDHEAAAILEMNMDLSSNINELDQINTNTAVSLLDSSNPAIASILNKDKPSHTSAAILNLNNSTDEKTAAILNLEQYSIPSPTHGVNRNLNDQNEAVLTYRNFNEPVKDDSKCNKEVFTLSQLNSVNMEQKIRR